jgi:hypothetical protein
MECQNPNEEIQKPDPKGRYLKLKMRLTYTFFLVGDKRLRDRQAPLCPQQTPPDTECRRLGPSHIGNDRGLRRYRTSGVLAIGFIHMPYL